MRLLISILFIFGYFGMFSQDISSLDVKIKEKNKYLSIKVKYTNLDTFDIYISNPDNISNKNFFFDSASIDSFNKLETQTKYYIDDFNPIYFIRLKPNTSIKFNIKCAKTDNSFFCLRLLNRFHDKGIVCLYDISGKGKTFKTKQIEPFFYSLLRYKESKRKINNPRKTFFHTWLQLRGKWLY